MKEIIKALIDMMTSLGAGEKKCAPSPERNFGILTTSLDQGYPVCKIEFTILR